MAFLLSLTKFTCNEKVHLLSFAASCTSQQTKNNKKNTEMGPEKNEDGEWELHVLDPGYESFLISRARPTNMFSEQTLKNKNHLLVTEWNSHFYSGRYRNIIKSAISYDRNENYGFEFENRLYQVFAYVSWRYKLRMKNLSMTDSYP